MPTTPARLPYLGLFLLALLPAAWLAWNNRDMPHFGHHHDDGLYMVSAKSLAEGSGYRIVSLPGQPNQTKYPPGYPLYLSLAWRLVPQFPANLPVVTALNWILLPVLLLLCRWVFPESAKLTLLLALSPYLVFLGISAMSELPATCLLLAVIGLASRQSGTTLQSAALAGLAAAAGFLVKSALLMLLFAVPAWYLWKRRPRHAFLFAACMAPAVIGWQLWAARNSTPVGDDLVYYTQYITYWLRNVSLAELPNMVLKNLDGLLTGMGGLFWFNPPGSFLHSAAARVLAVAAIAGVFRLLDRPSVQIYSLFAIPFIAQLLLWNFTPHERFTLPLFPLLLLGLAATSRHLLELYRQSRAQQPIASALIAGTWAILLAAALVRNGEGMFVSLPQLCEQDRRIAAAQQPVYRWLRESAPNGATVVTTDDSTLYLHTGRPALARLLPTRLFYEDDRDAILAFYSQLPSLPVRFLLLGPPIHRGQMGERDRAQVQNALAGLPNAQAVRQWGDYSLYAIAPVPAHAAR